MHDIFIIQELLEHILNFVPRRLIIACVLTCKNFYNTIPIDYNQDTVAMNSDMFSLLKIPYSTRAVISIAGEYNNNDMVEYLINKNPKYLEDYEVIRIIGYLGNEHLLSKLSTKIQSSYVMIIGLCEGSHIKLFETYIKYLHNFDTFELVKIIYKLNNHEMKNKIISYAKETRPGYNEVLIYGKLVGKCARKDQNYVFKNIQKLITNNKFSQYDYITYVCDALIEGEHYDILIWFLDQEIIRKQYKYECNDDDNMQRLIKNNNLKMFSYILTNNCAIWSYKGYNVVQNVRDISEKDYLDFCGLVECCIDYRRIEILTFLIHHIRFNFIRYQEFLDKSVSLKFDEITNVLTPNKHLFISYIE